MKTVNLTHITIGQILPFTILVEYYQLPNFNFLITNFTIGRLLPIIKCLIFNFLYQLPYCHNWLTSHAEVDQNL